MVGVAGVKSAMKGPVAKTEKAFGREAFGSGRQPGEVGRPVSRGWRWNSGSSGGGLNSGSGGGWSSGSSGGGFNSGSSGYHPGSTTNRPPAHGAGWGYPSSTSRPWSSSVNGGQGYNPGTGGSQDGFNPGTSGSGGSSQGGFNPGVGGRSAFSKQYIRVIKTPNSAIAGPVKKAPPFLTDEVEIVIPVEPCKEYEFELKIVSPQNSKLGKITDIRLPVLADIADYVPPPFTSA